MRQFVALKKLVDHHKGMIDKPSSDNAKATDGFPLVTIGLPTYNRPDGLEKALTAILAQDYPNLEIIISDNCSTNEKVQTIIATFANKDKRIQNYRQASNIGLESNFNFVFEKSIAAYFIWMSDDDIFESNYITECVKFLEAHPDHVLCSGVAKYYAGGDFVFDEKMFRVNQHSRTFRLGRYFIRVEKNGNFYGVFRNRLFQSKPIGDHMGTDWSFMGKLAVWGKLSFINTTAYHRSAEGNSGTKKKMIQRFGLKGWRKSFFEFHLSAIIAKNVFSDPAVNSKFSWVGKKLTKAMIFCQIMSNLIIYFLKKKFGIRKL